MTDRMSRPLDYVRRAERAARRWLIPPSGELPETIELFDCNVCIGTTSGRAAGSEGIGTAGSIAAELSRLSVANALVRHGIALETGPAAANTRINDDLAGTANLHPTWSLLPEATGETDFPDEAVDRMIAGGARAVWLYPRSHNYTLRRWCAGSLLSTLQYRHVPVFIPYDEVDVDELHEALGYHEHLNVVLANVDYSTSRWLYPLMAEHANLHMDLGAPHSQGGFLEEVVGRFGPLRLLFGSGFPDHEIGPAISYLLYADLRDEDKRLIGAGNLRSFIEEVA